MKRIFVKIFPYVGGFFGICLGAILWSGETGAIILGILGFGICVYFLTKTDEILPSKDDKNYEKIEKAEEKRVEELAEGICAVCIIMIVFIILSFVIPAVWPKYERYNRTCRDLTSIDYNRQNDFKCVNTDGEVKRMDKEGVLEFLDLN